jgi:hypothetical protein
MRPNSNKRERSILGTQEEGQTSGIAQEEFVMIIHLGLLMNSKARCRTLGGCTEPRGCPSLAICDQYGKAERSIKEAISIKDRLKDDGDGWGDGR